MRSAAFRLMLAVTVLGFGGHALLLPVLPLWVSEGGAGAFGAGTTTLALMAATVAVQVSVPALIVRTGYRPVLGVGLLLLGAPVPFLLLGQGLPLVLGISVLRGVGFALLTVAGSALVAELVPSAEHGRASARYGYAIGLPQLALLPLGVATVDAVGFEGVFVAATAAPLLGAVLVPFLRVGAGAGAGGAAPGVAADAATAATAVDVATAAGEATAAGGAPLAGGASVAGAAEAHPPLRLAAVGPMAAMLAGSFAQGGLVTFLTLAAPGTAAVVPVALFAAALGGVVGRGLAGPLVDRRGPGRLLVPGGLTSAVGMIVEVAAVGTVPWLLVPGALAVGLGFGLVQNDALVALFAAAGPARYGTASAAWNIGFDAGTGAGAGGMGAIAEPFGYRAAFAAGAALLVLAAAVGRRPVAGPPTSGPG